jgi:hypothetical protein
LDLADDKHSRGRPEGDPEKPPHDRALRRRDARFAAFTSGVRSALADRPGTRTRRKVADQTRANKAAARAATRRKAD